MKRQKKGNRLLDSHALVIVTASCQTQCGARAAIAVQLGLGDVSSLAGKGLTILGWSCSDPVAKTWRCPRCLERLATIRGVTEEVDYAMSNKKRAAMIEVEERAA